VNVSIVGAGAIGTLYAAKLSTGAPVKIISRVDRTSSTRQIRVTGLEDIQANVTTGPAVDAIEPATIVFVTTKAYDAAGAVGPLVPLLNRDTTIVCLQNGLHVEDEVKSAIGQRCQVVRAITYFGAVLEAPYEVSLRAHGYTSIETSAASAPIAELLTRCGMDGRISANIQQEVWKKTIFNAVINPLTGMTGMEVGWIADNRLDPLKRGIIAECVAVARHEGITFEGDLAEAINVTFRASKNLSSTYQDLLKGHRTEIDFLNGAVVALGRRYGIECPMNAALVALIKALESAAHASTAAQAAL
jgi:2-dehydropantoate 2-reductase